MLKRFIIVLFTVGVTVIIPGCPAVRRTAPSRTTGGRRIGASEVTVWDEGYASLLLRGFYPSEGPWNTRWTASKFAVNLERPAGPEVVYVVLNFRLSPEIIQAHPSISIQSRVNGVALPRRSFTKAGVLQYVETVPEDALAKQPAEVEFEVDQAIPLSKYGNAAGSLMVYSIALSHPVGTLVDRAQEIVQARQGYQYLLAKRDQVFSPQEQTAMMRMFHQVPIWQHMFFQNVAIEKNPLDLWMMQQLIYEVQPELVIETGTWMGGSALYFAHTLNGMGLVNSRVVTIDLQSSCATAQTNPLWKKYVTFLQGSSTDPGIVARVAQMAQGKRTLVTLDSDHSMAHVSKELQAYAPLVSQGSYLIVEDTNLDGVPIAPEFIPGPMAAVRQFLKQGAGEMFEQDVTREAYLVTFNPGGWLRRK